MCIDFLKTNFSRSISTDSITSAVVFTVASAGTGLCLETLWKLGNGGWAVNLCHELEEQSLSLSLGPVSSKSFHLGESPFEDFFVAVASQGNELFLGPHLFQEILSD